MVDYDIESQERTTTDHPVFGYDEAGRAHRYDPIRATIIRLYRAIREAAHIR